MFFSGELEVQLLEQLRMSKFYLKLLNQTLFSQLIFPMRKHHLQLDRNENNNNIILVFAYIHRNHHRVRELAMRCVSKILRSVRLQFMLPSMCLAQFFFPFCGLGSPAIWTNMQCHIEPRMELRSSERAYWPEKTWP